MTLNYTCKELKDGMCKKDDGSEEVYCEQRSRFIFRRLTFEESLKTFITEYMLVARFIIS